MDRSATVERKTKETDIRIELDLDHGEMPQIDSGIPFMDHMLHLMAAHGFMGLRVAAKGDTEIDDHHTVEDLGICLGEAIRQAVGDKKGIKRYGQATVPMDEALARVVVDISNRAYLAYRVVLNDPKTGKFDVRLVREFLRALVSSAGITLHVDLCEGEDPHHAAEAIFKAFGRALDEAVQPEERSKGAVPSTKGVL
jgi:imidazoleglycerol-phosphate dehydratase